MATCSQVETEIVVTRYYRFIASYPTDELETGQSLAKQNLTEPNRNYGPYQVFCMKSQVDSRLHDWDVRTKNPGIDSRLIERRVDNDILFKLHGIESRTDGREKMYLCLEVHRAEELIPLNVEEAKELQLLVDDIYDNRPNLAVVFAAGDNYWYNGILPLLQAEFPNSIIYQDRLNITNRTQASLLIDLSVYEKFYFDRFFQEVEKCNSIVDDLRNRGVGAYDADIEKTWNMKLSSLNKLASVEILENIGSIQYGGSSRVIINEGSKALTPSMPENKIITYHGMPLLEADWHDSRLYCRGATTDPVTGIDAGRWVCFLDNLIDRPLHFKVGYSNEIRHEVAVALRGVIDELVTFCGGLVVVGFLEMEDIIHAADVIEKVLIEVRGENNIGITYNVEGVLSQASQALLGQAKPGSSAARLRSKLGLGEDDKVVYYRIMGEYPYARSVKIKQ